MYALVKYILLLCAIVTAEAIRAQERFIPVHPGASDGTRQLLNWIGNLPSRSGNRLLSGQFAGHGNEIAVDGPGGQWARYVEALYTATGKYPAVVSIDYEYAAIYTPAQLQEANACLIRHWKAGGLVSINYTPRNPFTDGSTRDRNLNGKTLLDLTDPSKPEYHSWHRRLDVIADALAELRDSGVIVLWRPLQEMNGTWFWYSDDNYNAVYIDMFDYFRKKGLNNLIWVWSVAEFQKNKVVWSRYPGRRYVDIVGCNPYNNDVHMNVCYSMLRTDPRTSDKIFAVTENGWKLNEAYGTNDNRKIINAVRMRYPDAVWHMSWHDWGNNNKHALISNLFAKEFMEDPWVITRDEVNWRGDGGSESD